MIRLSTWMVLFWTLAEGTILIAMHWGLSRLQGSRHSKAKQIKSNQIKSNQIKSMTMIGATLFALVIIVYALGREWLLWVVNGCTL